MPRTLLQSMGEWSTFPAKLLRETNADNPPSETPTMALQHRSCIRLVNAAFYARHGVHSEEQLLGGRYEVDAELWLDLRDAAATDDIGKTVNYQGAYDAIREVMAGGSTCLIEALACEIASRLMQAFPVLESVVVKVRKRSVPLGGLCDYAEAEYRIGKE